MQLTREITDKIEEAWQYGASSSCQWAMSELDKFVKHILKGSTISVQEDDLQITTLLEFVIWKNKKWILSQISILNDQDILDKINLIDKLILELKPDTLKFNETDPNNHYFILNLQSTQGNFKLFLGKLSELDSIPAYSIRIKSCKIRDDNTFEIISDSEKKQLKFTHLELK